MSYSLSGTVNPGDTTALEESVGAQLDAATGQTKAIYEAAAAPIAAAIKAAGAVVDEVARPGDGFSWSISGHHNADRNPNPGWSDCYVSVRLSQIPGPNEAAADGADEGEDV